MSAFEFVSAQSVEDASQLMTTSGAAGSLIAGGTDLLGEVKEGTVGPQRLVALQTVNDLAGIGVYERGTIIGAMTTIADVGGNGHIRSRFPALAQACDSIATPQIRNVGTLGGNLCQRPRCWYYRSRHFDCLKKGGDHCFAFEGMNKFHSVFDVDDCPAVHPSDTAVALTALDARVLLMTHDGARMLPIEEFFITPKVDVTSENILMEGEILAEIVIPTAPVRSRSVFLKAKERQAMDFALASVAASVDVDGGTIRSARVVLGGVAPKPLRMTDAEEALTGRNADEVDPAEIGRIAVEGATPLSDNGFKVRLASGLVRRAVRTLLSDDQRLSAQR